METKTEALKKVETAKMLPSAKFSETTKNGVGNTQKAGEKAEKEKTAELIKKFEPSAELRLQRLSNFTILGEKHTFLKKKEDELSKFIVSSDGTREKITLSNASGFTFEVSNRQTIEKVVQVIENDLKSFIQKSEMEILNFQI